MKKILSSLALGIAIVTPSMSHAYFPSHFDYKSRATQQYVPDPVLHFLPGWPDWIGRLNTFAEFVYSEQYEKLNTEQKDVVEKLSEGWPDWIGLPTFVRGR